MTRPFLVLTHLAALCLVASTAAAELHLVRMPLKSPAQVEELRRQGLDIVAFTRDGMDLVVDDKQLQELRRGRYPVAVIESATSARTTVLDTNLGLYTTYAELAARIATLAGMYPALVDTFSIGTSIEGRAIRGIKISDNVATDEDEPEALIMGNLHARELMAVEIPIMLADYLLANYGVDSTVTYLVDNREIFIIPMLNPDGHVYVENNNAGYWGTWWRKNRRDNGGSFGVDLNRNWGYQWGYDNSGSSPTPSNELYRGSGPFSEPETQAIRTFVNGREFTVWLSYHSYGELLLYPWGYDYINTPDHEVYLELGRRMSAFNNYFAGNAAMGAIYLVNGGSDDWGYGEQGEKPRIYAFTPEVNSSAQGGFGPPDALIVPTFNLNLEMNLLLLEYADSPESVLGPYRPTMYAVAGSPANATHHLTWSGNNPVDPNPIVAWEIEGCLNPSTIVDTATTGADGWDVDGFSVTGSGYQGQGYYSGQGNSLFNTMTTSLPFIVSVGDTLTLWTNYDIEINYDYAYVEVSNDAGLHWVPIAGNITTSLNPTGNNRGNGITGSSGGWVAASFPLTAYATQEILVRLSYVTDGALILTGITFDNISHVPTCEATVQIFGITEPEYYVVPVDTGTWCYRTRGQDADGDMSLWSNSQCYSVYSLTDAPTAQIHKSSLGRNYPNPFNPTTTIPYVVGGSGDESPRPVSLRIYDVSGALVRTLIEGNVAVGQHITMWDGRTAGGAVLPTGVYFSRLTVAGETVATQKLVLIK